MATNATRMSSLRVSDLRCEYLSNPLGLAVVHPRLSWKLVADQRGALQTAYHIRLTSRHDDVLWDTGKVLSAQSLHIPYRGPELHSRKRYTWQVRVWDGADCPSAWSELAWWEMGLLQTTDWQARWIEPD